MDAWEWTVHRGLTRPWFAALATTIVLYAGSIALLIVGDEADTGSEQLSTLAPYGTEIVLTAVYAAVMFLVLWALISLCARLSARGRKARD
jgi:formate hydrogenlyase subunit 3/multisubunit Na+/H+ antiporter MnhD subunit